MDVLEESFFLGLGYCSDGAWFLLELSAMTSPRVTLPEEEEGVDVDGAERDGVK